MELSQALGTDLPAIPPGIPGNVQSKMREQAKAEAGMAEAVAAKTKELSAPIQAAKEQEVSTQQAKITAAGEQLAKPLEVPKETVQDMAALGGLAAVVGVMLGSSGKQSAQNVLNSMTGILDGYKKGNNDLIAKYQKEFDMNQKRLQSQIQQAQTELSVILEKYKVKDQTVAQDIAAFAAKYAGGIAEKVADGKSASAVANLQMQLAQMNQTRQLEADRIKRENDRRIAEDAAKDRVPVYYDPKRSVWLNSKGQLIPGSEGTLKTPPKEAKSLGTVGNAAELQRLLPEQTVSLNEKDSKPIVEAIYSTKRLADFIDKANDPTIDYGEIGRISNKMQSFLNRNIPVENAQDSQRETDQAVNAAVKELGLSPNDKNIVFYKEAIFNIMEAERAIRGGSILPVAIMQRLTPLMDPANMSRDQFIAIMQGNLQRVAQSTRLQPELLRGALSRIEPFDYTPKEYNVRTPAFVIDKIYTDKSGNRSKYKGKDASGEDIWEDQ